MKEKEIWENIPNYEGLYQVSNLGRIKSLAREWNCGNTGGKNKHPDIIMKQYIDKKGYCTIDLWKNNIGKNFRVHRLILIVFIGKSSLEVNHKDTNKINNKLENLEWVTPKQNMEHARKNGLLKKSKKARKNEYSS